VAAGDDLGIIGGRVEEVVVVVVVDALYEGIFEGVGAVIDNGGFSTRGIFMGGSSIGEFDSLSGRIEDESSFDPVCCCCCCGVDV
jgi:hypothetical protein